MIKSISMSSHERPDGESAEAIIAQARSVIEETLRSYSSIKNLDSKPMLRGDSAVHPIDKSYWALSLQRDENDKLYGLEIISIDRNAIFIISVRRNKSGRGSNLTAAQRPLTGMKVSVLQTALQAQHLIYQLFGIPEMPEEIDYLSLPKSEPAVVVDSRVFKESINYGQTSIFNASLDKFSRN